MPPPPQANPFPGLRPFEPDEDHLFFGREDETDDLLRQLRHSRFLSVIGTSGCGKSSLVRSGLIPTLHSGLMVDAGSTWRVAIARPGEDPIGHLAAALDHPRILAWQAADELAATNRVMIEATLRRGTLGLVEAVDQTHLPASDNLLILVDQFEELFRFRRVRDAESSREEAAAFVKLLLEAAAQRDLPIYVVITMRSDFIGECMDYPGLPEALNHGQYLVPKMTRDELRSAITGPVAVAGAEIAPRLVRRLLNDIGDNQDELPLLQHALMRTWEHWREQNAATDPIDLVNYESIGTLRNALSLHAEEAYAETLDGPRPWIAQRVFKALSDTFSDPRGVRRPTSVAELAAACEVDETEVIRIVEIFRRPGRTFLTPPAPVPLASRTIVDLSHESLMRCWTRLIRWAEEERGSAELYTRLSREAAWHAAGTAGLWDDPELELGLRWRRDNHPTAAWARRYDQGFDRAMAFLDASEQARDQQRDERRTMRIRRLLFAWGTAAVLLVMTGILLVLWVRASRAQDQAQQNFQAARDAVNELLSSVDRDITRVGADAPELQQFRRDLLEKAKRFYIAFSQIQPDSDDVVNDLALAHLRLGHIHRMLEAPESAVDEYQRALSRFRELVARDPANAGYRQAMADAYNWLGETYRTLPDRRTEAEAAYGQALELQTALVGASPSTLIYQQELARTYYNRGILRHDATADGQPASPLAEADFRQAVALLEPLARRAFTPTFLQDLARAYNNLASHIADDAAQIDEAQSLTARAIALHDRLIAADPGNREYKLELAKFSDNMAFLQLGRGDIDGAMRNNRRAQDLLDDLVRPAPGLGIEHADAHTVAGFIFERRQPQEAARAYADALADLKEVAKSADVSRNREFHSRFGDLVGGIVALGESRAGFKSVSGLVNAAVTFYVPIGTKAIDGGKAADVARVLEALEPVRTRLTGSERAAIDALATALQRNAPPKAPSGKATQGG